MSELVEILLQSWWGITIVTAVILLTCYAIYREASTDKFTKEIKQEVARLGRDMPGMQWKTIEWRARKAAEALYQAWETGEFVEFSEQCTASFYQRYRAESSSLAKGQKTKPPKLVGIKVPAPVYVQTPNESRPATVGVLLQISALNRIATGTKTEGRVLQFVYDDQGDWKCDGIVDVDLAKDISGQVDKSDFSTFWLRNNAVAKPSTAALSQELPEHAKNCGVGYALIFYGVLALLASSGLLYTQILEAQKKQTEAEIRESGTKTIAKLDQDCELIDGEFCEAKYSFQVEGFDQPFSYKVGSFAFGRPMIRGEAARSAIKTKKIAVIYDPDAPERNVPETEPALRITGDLIAGWIFIVATFFGGIWLLKMGFQPNRPLFWATWKP